MKTVEWAWNSDPDTPDEKLVLIAMARDTYRTPLVALAIVGSRVLRHAVCDMTPAELDVVLASLERQGYITPYEDTDGTVGRRIGILNREHAQEGRGRHGVSTSTARRRDDERQSDLMGVWPESWFRIAKGSAAPSCISGP